MDSRIPDPSDHPSFYDPEYGLPNLDVYANGVQREIEERSEREIETNALVFGEWCSERKDSADFATLASLASEFYTHGPKRGSQFSDAITSLRHDYATFRVEQARQTGEWDEIARQLDEEARDAARESA